MTGVVAGPLPSVRRRDCYTPDIGLQKSNCGMQKPRNTRRYSTVRFVSRVAPPSGENDWARRADVGVMSDHACRTTIAPGD
jgi:hypothetical protein